MNIFDLLKSKFDREGDWEESLIWCPSQCSKEVVIDGKSYKIYLRWRHNDPWQMKVIKLEDGEQMGWSEDLFVKNNIYFTQNDNLGTIENKAEKIAYKEVKDGLEFPY